MYPVKTPDLVRHGADVNARDLGPALGDRSKNEVGIKNNSLLHCCVLHGKDEMYRHLTQKLAANAWAVNNNGDTPLLLAAACRSLKMVRVAMDGMKQTLWTFGPVSCVRYPLYEIEHGSNSREIGKDDGQSRSSNEGDGRDGRSFANLANQTLSTASSFFSSRRHPSGSVSAVRRKWQRRTVLQIIDAKNAHELLYMDVLWRLLNDKYPPRPARTESEPASPRPRGPAATMLAFSVHFSADSNVQVGLFWQEDLPLVRLFERGQSRLPHALSLLPHTRGRVRRRPHRARHPRAHRWHALGDRRCLLRR